MTESSESLVDGIERALGSIARGIGSVHLPAGEVQAVLSASGPRGITVYTLGAHRFVKRYSPQLGMWLSIEIFIEVGSEDLAWVAANILFDTLQSIVELSGDFLFPMVFSILRPGNQGELDDNLEVLVFEGAALKAQGTRGIFDRFGVLVLQVVPLLDFEVSIYYERGLSKLLEMMNDSTANLGYSGRFRCE